MPGVIIVMVISLYRGLSRCLLVPRKGGTGPDLDGVEGLRAEAGSPGSSGVAGTEG